MFMPQDLKLPGDQVDVNVHPTKHEVVFLHQDEILACINEAVEGLLQGPIRCEWRCVGVAEIRWAT